MMAQTSDDGTSGNFSLTSSARCAFWSMFFSAIGRLISPAKIVDVTLCRHARALLSKQARILTLNRKNRDSSLVGSPYFGPTWVDRGPTHAEMASREAEQPCSGATVVIRHFA